MQTAVFHESQASTRQDQDTGSADSSSKEVFSRLYEHAITYHLKSQLRETAAELISKLNSEKVVTDLKHRNSIRE
jgi:predicted small metal-binding protein